jgi:hypothetical protein
MGFFVRKFMAALKMLNLALAFFLELAALAAFAYWGFTANSGVLAVLLGVGAPLLLAVVWGLYLAPRSSKRLKGMTLAVTKLVIFGLAALCLVAAGQRTVGLIFAAVSLIHVVLSVVWNQENAALEGIA